MQRQDFKALLLQLDDYFSTIERDEPQKFEARKQSYIAIQNAIFNLDGEELRKVCGEALKEFQGKGLGRQAYSQILNRLQLIDTQEQLLQLNTVFLDREEDKLHAFIKGMADVKVELVGYLTRVKGEIEYGRTKMFDMGGKDLKEKKSGIADSLYIAIDAFESKQDKNEDDVSAIAKVVATALQENKEAVKGKLATAGVLGKSLAKASELLNRYYPVEYLEAKEDVRLKTVFKPK